MWELRFYANHNMGAPQPAPLQEKLLRLRREAEERAAERLAAKLRLPHANLSKTPISLEAVKLIPEAEAKEARAAAIELKMRHVALAAVYPERASVKKIIEELTAKKYTVKLFVTSQSGIEEAWKLYKFVSEEAKDITGKVEIEKKRLEELVAKLNTFQAVAAEIKAFDFTKLSTTRLLETVLAGSLANKASDIHFEAGEKSARIRFRLDGLLHDIYNDVPLRHYEGIINRIKLLSALKINVRGEPQDGRFTIGLSTKEVEVRVSIIPSEFGETIVMRLLDPDVINVDLERLGLRPDDLLLVKAQLKQPNGLLLNTGPTGSGKTTTLYAFLRQINSPEVKIITIEDPIEYRLEGIEQTQVDPEASYTFASGLRAIVRQDPDVILVGEIRDAETAEIAMQSALTGHLVFSTLHTNDAVGAVPRLLELGVKTSVLGPALSLVIAQRLVRILCPDCKKPETISKELAAKIKKFLECLPARVDRKAYKTATLFAPVGCDQCNHLGYRGRLGIFEFLETGTDFKEMILKEVSEASLAALARTQEMVSMQEDGVLKALTGITTLAEVEEITGPIKW